MLLATAFVRVRAAVLSVAAHGWAGGAMTSSVVVTLCMLFLCIIDGTFAVRIKDLGAAHDSDGEWQNRWYYQPWRLR